MDDISLTQELCSFISESPTAFHAAANMAVRLDEAGFVCLHEADHWDLQRGGSYYVLRNGSSLVAWRIGAHLPQEGYDMRMAAVHGDSPTFRIKHVSEISGPGDMLRLNVEGYGGMLDATWLDRPLGIAGRVVVRTDDGTLESRLVATPGEVALIPNVAIHQRRDANQGFPYNHQVDLIPLFSAGALTKGAFDDMVAQLADTTADRVLGKDLCLINRTAPRVWGWAHEFVSAPRLDNLQCTYAGFEAFVSTSNPGCVTVFTCFDSEEVGSGTRQGACSTLLRDVLLRTSRGLGGSDEDFLRTLASSFLVSCDNGHALHPNHPELYDSDNAPRINGGVVIKETARQKYATDAWSRAVFSELCERAGVLTQTFANRSDSMGGSTLGNLSGRQVSVPTVDVGLAQLAMHSSYETAGVADTGHLLRALEAFYAADLRLRDGCTAELR